MATKRDVTPFKPRAQAKVRKHVTNLMTSDEEYALVKEMAELSGVSIQDFVHQAVMYALDNMEPRL